MFREDNIRSSRHDAIERVQRGLGVARRYVREATAPVTDRLRRLLAQPEVQLLLARLRHLLLGSALRRRLTVIALAVLLVPR